jgi:tripeptide aminopeptidase
MIEGGEASNQVTDKVRVTGECRSHDPEFLEAILKVYRDAFERAAASVKNSAGKKGRVKFKAKKDYDAFALDRQDPVVRYAFRAAKGIGLKPTSTDVNGGLDANALNRKGIPTITFGAGQHSPHTVEEHVDIREYLDGCRLAVALAVGT